MDAKATTRPGWNETRRCKRCTADVFFNGTRWAGVFVLASGDACIAGDEWHADHEPEDD